MNGVWFIHLLICLSLISCLHCCNAAGNVLIFSSYGEGSHFTSAARIGNELYQRGNNVTLVISNAFEHRARDPQYTNLSFQVFKHNVPPEEVIKRLDRATSSAFRGAFLTEVLSNISMLFEELRDDCQALFDDAELLKRLRDAHFDIALVDPLWPCAVLVAEYAADRFVLLMLTAWVGSMARLAGNPSNPATTPESLTGFTDKMTFTQRLQNVISVLLGQSLLSFYDVYIPIKRAHGICPELEMVDLFGRAQLVIVNVDFAVEYSIPLQPNFVAVGGLSVAPAKPLMQDLEEFVQSSGDAGIIVFSLGTYITYMQEEFVEIFAKAFSELPQKVIWQYRGTPPAFVSNITNIRTMNWLPQNDLLGHNKTRAFMYQGGNNGLYEALYHAVPVVVIPLIGDQPDVAARVTSRGMGLSLDIKTITTDKIVHALNAVINEKQYKETASRLSAIYHDRPMRPVEKAAFWIEHVMKYGGEYMRSPVHDIPWYQYYLLDVIALLIAVLVFIVLAILFSCRFALRCCKRLMFSTKAKTD